MSKDICWALEVADVEWDMAWDEESQKRFGVPPVEKVFVKENAIAHLLMNEVCIIGGFIEGASTQPVQIAVLCSDTFAYACADLEPLHEADVEELYGLWRADPLWGPTAWAVKKRRERPISPVEKNLRARGYDIDAWLGQKPAPC